INSAVATITGNLSRLQGQLDAHTFDPITGAKVPTLTGAAREQAERQLALAKQSAGYDLGRLAALKAQREGDALSSAQSQEEALARAAFSRGNPARAKLWDEAIARKEAERAADRVIDARFAAL